MRSRLALLLLCVAVLSCRSRNPNIVTVGTDDAQMTAAIDSARRTVSVVLSHLSAPAPNQTYLSIKARVGTDLRGEHIWLSDLSYGGGMIRGRLTDNAETVEGFKAGDWVTTRPDSISDWLIVTNGTICGGFTLRVLRARLSPQEQAGLDSGLAAMGARGFVTTNRC